MHRVLVDQRKWIDESRFLHALKARAEDALPDRRRATIRPSRLGGNMAAYVIAEIEVTDPALYEDYRKQVPATVEKHGGRFIVRGGKVEALEGGWSPKRLVVLEFPTLQKALGWYRSADYAPLIKLRQRASRGKLIAIEGA